MARTLRLVVFDYDGTLVDSQAAICSITATAFAEHGLAAPTTAEVRRGVGLALERALARLLPEPEDASLVTAVCASYRRHAQALRLTGILAHEPLFPGMREVVEELDRSGTLLAIATGKNRRGLVASLEAHGLSRHFTVLKTADDGPSKPHPEILQQAIRECGVEPATTIMVGDTSYDVLMACNAGAPALGVAWGYHASDELIAAGARAVADTPIGLATMIEEALA